MALRALLFFSRNRLVTTAERFNNLLANLFPQANHFGFEVAGVGGIGPVPSFTHNADNDDSVEEQSEVSDNTPGGLLSGIFFAVPKRKVSKRSRSSCPRASAGPRGRVPSFAAENVYLIASFVMSVLLRALLAFEPCRNLTAGSATAK
jgi:hypothetical protein